MSLPSISRFFALILVVSAFGAPLANAATAVSKAEGADRSSAARASQWVGTVIGVNFGEHSVVITEGVLIDHIKKFAQRSVKITSDTEIYKNGQLIAFDDLDVGQRITAQGAYNATKRIVTAERIDVGVKVATVAAAKTEKVAAVIENSKTVTTSTIVSRNIQKGSTGADVIALQKFLIAKKYLALPSSARLGTFGIQTRAAVQKYQKSVGLPTTGTVGPQTRARLNKS